LAPGGEWALAGRLRIDGIAPIAVTRPVQDRRQGSTLTDRYSLSGN
jgi:hypothetical protein